MKCHISLPEDLVLQAKEHAQERGATFSGLIRISLEQQLLKK